MPQFLTELLIAHCAWLDTGDGPMADSDLLFPGINGSYGARSVLDASLAQTSEKDRLGFVITPTASRRTFKDLARLIGITRVGGRSISISRMEHVYSTALDHEQRDALLGVAGLAGLGFPDYVPGLRHGRHAAHCSRCVPSTQSTPRNDARN